MYAFQTSNAISVAVVSILLIAATIKFFRRGNIHNEKQSAKEIANDQLVLNAMEALLDEFRHALHPLTATAKNQISFTKLQNKLFAFEPDNRCYTLGDPMSRGYALVQITIKGEEIFIYSPYSTDAKFPISQMGEAVACAKACLAQKLN